MNIDRNDKRVLARADFEKAMNKAFFNKLVNFLFNQNNRLFQFEEVKYLLSPTGMVYRGLRNIPIERIIGSEGRYEDFDINFLPQQEHTRDRWENIDIAHMDYVELPPISVYQLGDFYFVKDGNHRVSVARRRGQKFIDAEVVELFSKVKIDERFLNEKGLLLAESYKYFLDKSQMDKILPGVDIKLTHPWGYYRLLEHINTYKYLESEKLGKDIGWSEALPGWYGRIYTGTIALIQDSGILRRFPGRTVGDLYIWVMDHWHYLKNEYGDVEITEAVESYSHKFGKGFFSRIWERVKKWFHNLITGSKKE